MTQSSLKNKLANISLKIFKNEHFASVPNSPTQMGSLSVNNSVTNISRLGTFHTASSTAPQAPANRSLQVLNPQI